jgi:hypothetical protein
VPALRAAWIARGAIHGPAIGRVHPWSSVLKTGITHGSENDVFLRSQRSLRLINSAFSASPAPNSTHEEIGCER